MPDSELKKALVIGATRGLGLEISNSLKANGYIVVGTSRTSDDLVSRSANIGFELEFLDLSETEGIGSKCHEIVMRHGVPDVIVMNSGVGNNRILATLHDSEIETTIKTNLIGPLVALKYLTRAMLPLRRGTVVVIGSVSAKTGYSGLAAYGASKAGLEGAVRGLSRELGKRGIRINIVHPGFLETQMTEELDTATKTRIASRSPMKRLALTREVANAVLFLSSPESSGITGTCLVVDVGGTS